MQTILVVVHLFLAIGIVTLVLVQHGKGADAGAAFGSGASATVFGAHGSTSFLSRATGVLAALFFVTSMTLAYYASQSGKPRALMDQIAPNTVTVPAAPLKGGAAGISEVPQVPPAEIQPAAQGDMPPAAIIEAVDVAGADAKSHEEAQTQAFKDAPPVVVQPAAQGDIPPTAIVEAVGVAGAAAAAKLHEETQPQVAKDAPPVMAQPVAAQTSPAPPRVTVEDEARAAAGDKSNPYGEALPTDALPVENPPPPQGDDPVDGERPENRLAPKNE